MKTILTVILAFMMLGCGSDNMAHIGEEVDSTLTATNVTDDTQVYNTAQLTLSASNGSSSFMIVAGVLYSTGLNDTGQLGLGDTTDRDDFISTGITNVKSVYSSSNSTFVIKNDGTTLATGNTSKNLGLGASGDEIITFTDIGIANVRSVSSGLFHTMLIKTDGTLWATGSNANGQLGAFTNESKSVFTNTGMTDVISVSTGIAHTAIIDKSGNVWTSGSNTYGELGLGDNTQRDAFVQTSITNAVSISCGDSSTLVKLFTEAGKATGLNTSGQLGVGDYVNKNSFTSITITGIAQIVAGGTHSAIIKTDATYWATGNNFYGQLGDGTTTNTNVFVDTGEFGISATSCGAGYTILKGFFGIIQSVGLNSVGQLGLGDTTNRLTLTTNSKTSDGYVVENWISFYQGDIVRIDDYRYTVSLPTEETPNIFTTLTQIGAVNELKPFDGQNITPAISSSPMTYTIKGTEPFNAFTLAKVLATSITYIFKNDVGATIKTDTVAIDCKRDKDGILSLYPTTVTYYAGQQMPIDSTVEITLTHTSDIELGDFTLNNMIDSGFTNLAFSHAIKDFNDYTPDAWGNIPESVKAIVTTFNVSMDVLLTNYDYAVSFNESIAGKNVTIDASDSDGAVADGETIFSSLTRRVRVNQPTMKSNVKDNSLGEFTTLTMKVQEIA